MTELRSGVGGYSWRRIVFTLVVLVPLVIYVGLFGMWRNQLLLITSWFGGFGLLEPIFYEKAHRLHEFAAAMLWWPMLVGLAVQLRSPRRQVAGMLTALVSIVAIFLAVAVTGGWQLAPILLFFGVPIAVATLLHPAGRDLLAGVTDGEYNTVLLALVLVAAVPMLAFAANQVGLQTGAVEPAHDHAGAGHDEEVHEAHVEFHHFMFVTGFAFAVIGLGLLASLQPIGWWLPAGLAGVMAAVFGLAALLAPEAASNPGLVWSVAAVLWGVAFVVASRLDSDVVSSTAYGAA